LTADVTEPDEAVSAVDIADHLNSHSRPSFQSVKRVRAAAGAVKLTPLNLSQHPVDNSARCDAIFSSPQTRLL
jgi:hypothetical protein